MKILMIDESKQITINLKNSIMLKVTNDKHVLSELQKLHVLGDRIDCQLNLRSTRRKSQRL